MSLLEHLRSVVARARRRQRRPLRVAGHRARRPDQRSSRSPAQPAPPPAASSRRDCAISARNEALMELKARVHEELIHELDPEQLVDDVSFTSPARRAVEQAAEERIGADRRHARPPGATASGVRDRRRSARLRSARAAAARPDDHRSHGQRLGPGVLRARRHHPPRRDTSFATTATS